MKNKARQIPIDFAYKTLYDRQDFMLSSSNEQALAIIDKWPNWGSSALNIYGSAGVGKTHLAHIFAENVYAKTQIPYKIPFIYAKDVKNEIIHRLFEQNKCLIVEDLNEDVDQEAIFHLYNLYRNEGGYILFTSTKPPARMKFSLQDLQSRLNSIPAIEVKEPDSELLSILIVKLFADRQINVTPEIINYITNNAERSLAYIKHLIEETDRVSIAKKRAVTIPIVKEAMSLINNNLQEDFFN